MGMAPRMGVASTSKVVRESQKGSKVIADIKLCMSTDFIITDITNGLKNRIFREIVLAHFTHYTVSP